MFARRVSSSVKQMECLHYIHIPGLQTAIKSNTYGSPVPLMFCPQNKRNASHFYSVLHVSWMCWQWRFQQCHNKVHYPESLYDIINPVWSVTWSRQVLIASKMLRLTCCMPKSIRLLFRSFRKICRMLGVLYVAFSFSRRHVFYNMYIFLAVCIARCVLHGTAASSVCCVMLYNTHCITFKLCRTLLRLS